MAKKREGENRKGGSILSILSIFIDDLTRFISRRVTAFALIRFRDAIERIECAIPMKSFTVSFPPRGSRFVAIVPVAIVGSRYAKNLSSSRRSSRSKGIERRNARDRIARKVGQEFAGKRVGER